MKLVRFVVWLGLTVASVPAGADTIRVTVDKGFLLRLDGSADTVLVAEPSIANVIIESPRQLFILGKKPGETNFFALTRDGRRIREANIVVVPNEERRVSVHRSVRESTLSCAPRCSGVETPGGGGTSRSEGRSGGAAGGSPTATRTIEERDTPGVAAGPRTPVENADSPSN
jgi:hypothetical protein